jgi:hypothetical protein
MKRLAFSLLIFLSIAAILSGCSRENSGSRQSGSEAKHLKTGLAFVTSLDGSADAGQSDGFVQADSVIAAVTTDDAGKIVGCFLDLVRTKAFFDSSGRIATPLDTVFPTNIELGQKADASEGDKEWFKQAVALADYFTGKTADEIKSIPLDNTGCASDPDLKALVQFPIDDFISAAVKAAAGAKDLGASEGDRIGAGAQTNILYSGGGNVLVYATFAAVTSDSENRITSSAADGFQCSVGLDRSGKIQSDLSAVPPTKNETGDAYGLKGSSSIGREWYEQTAALSEYVKGMTAAEIEGIALRADTSPSSSDLRATVTLKIGEFIDVFVKALRMAESL